MFFYLLLIVCFLLILLIYGFLTTSYSYWDKRKILSIKPKFPFGNLKGIGKSYHISKLYKEIYDKFNGKDVIAGMYFFIKPAVMILDPELIKTIFIKDFNNFCNRGFYYNEKADPLSAHLFSIEDDRWRNLRSKLTPTFSSGKMKLMYPTVSDIACHLVKKIDDIIETKNIIDLRDICARYTTDVIGTCAFGIECNSLNDPNTEFRVQGRNTFQPPGYKLSNVMFGCIYPNLAKRLGITTFGSVVTQFFYNIVNQAITYRKENNVKRNDFLQLLMDTEESENGIINSKSVTEIAAQSFLFFIAGFETSSTTMTFCLYELARNQNIQNKLRNEINDVLNESNGKITYENINRIPYLDQVIKETLRKYPSLDNLMRKACNDYNIPGTNYVIEKNTHVIIPVYAIQHDPNIYPNPDVFDPDRFTEANIIKRHQFTFLPFGEGPRTCLGLRFGIMQMRLGIINIIKNYQLTWCDETTPDIVFDVSSLTLAPNSPIFLNVKKLQL